MCSRNCIDMLQSNSVIMDTEAGAIESVHTYEVSQCIKWVEFRENVRASFPQGRRKLSVIIGVSVRQGLTVFANQEVIRNVGKKRPCRGGGGSMSPV